MSREIMQQALDALENHSGNYKLNKAESVRHNAAVEALRQALAQPEQKLIGWKDGEPQYIEQPEQWTPVEIGVDVTPDGAHVVGMCVLMPEAVRHVFYSQFHTAPPSKSEQEPEIVRRVRRYAGKRRESVGSPHITAKECIALANWIESALASPPKPWVGLTNDEMVEIREAHELHIYQIMFAVESKLREKNT